MTPEEIQKTTDFILRNLADSAIRMDRFAEEMREAEKKFWTRSENLQEQLDLLAAAARDLLEVSRRHEKRIGRLEGKEKQ